MAVNDPTTNYSWNLPNVSGDSGNWGTLLNAIIGDDSTGIDAVLASVSTVASAALPKAGGTMTGNLKTLTQTMTAVNLGATLSGAVGIDLSLGNFFYGTCTGTVTLSFSNVPASGTAVCVIIELTDGYVVNFPSGVTFGQDALKTVVASKVQTYALYTRDGGTKWRAGHLANMTP